MTFRHKLLVLAVAPLVVVTIGITLLLTWQSTRLAQSNIEAFEENMLQSKEAEIANLTSVALSSVQSIYDNAGPDDDQAKMQVAQILSSLDYGKDGYFFVYDYHGNNVVHPRQSFRTGKNWIELVDPDGDRVISELIKAARSGDGYHRYKWQKPSTQGVVDKVSYVIDLPKWNWVLGTGAYLDDVYAQTSAATLAMKERTRESFVMAAFFAVPAILIVFTGCVYVTLDERKMADGILKQLTQRVIDTQEQERSRLARELHDGVSQELLGVRFTMDLVGRNAAASTPDLDAAIKESIAALNNTIREIRAISHDLRPRILDDIGLAAAIKNLAEKLASRTGITLSLTSDRFVDNLPPAVRTAIFRVAQEALSNVERHSKASWLEIGLWSERGQARIRISDNGRGIDPGLASEGSGLGLQNMRERVSHFGGTLLIDSSPRGTSLLVRLPRPEGESKTPRRIAS